MSCQHCEQFQARWQGSIRLHAQTAEQLAAAETKLSAEKAKVRELEGCLLELVTNVRALGGNVSDSIQVKLGSSFTSRGRGRGC